MFTCMNCEFTTWSTWLLRFVYVVTVKVRVFFVSMNLLKSFFLLSIGGNPGRLSIIAPFDHLKKESDNAFSSAFLIRWKISIVIRSHGKTRLLLLFGVAISLCLDICSCMFVNCIQCGLLATLVLTLILPNNNSGIRLLLLHILHWMHNLKRYVFSCKIGWKLRKQLLISQLVLYEWRKQ